jgi:hypothetical protein
MSAWFFVVVLGLIGVFFLRTLRSRRALAQRVLLPTDEVILAANGVQIKAMSYGTKQVKGLDPKRAVRTRGRLAVSKDRFVLVTDQGVFLDMRRGQLRLLTSVRCTAPGRLVIEGDIPQAGRVPGVYRLEVFFEQAHQWPAVLQPFVDEDGPKFGLMPPTMS